MSNVKNCLDIIKGNDALESHFKGITDLSDVEQLKKAIDLAKSYHETLHKELESLKKLIDQDYKLKGFVKEDVSEKVEAAKKKYEAKEEVQPSPVGVGQGEAEGAAAVLTPKAGDQVIIPSKQTKGVITYVRKEDGAWYFKDSRGKWQKETAANQAKLDDQWMAAQGVQQEKSFQQFGPDQLDLVEGFYSPLQK